MTSQPSTRRRCLMSSVSLLSMLGCGAWSAVVAAAVPAHQTSAAASLLRLVTTPDAKEIGNAVLPQLPHTTTPALVHAIAARLSGFLAGSAVQGCDLAILHLGFGQAAQADFAQGRCLTVSGWVLARCEVELCALAALAARGANA